MVEPPASDRSGRLPDHLREFFAAALEYLQARAALAGVEAKEALIHFAIIAGLMAIAIGVILFGYLFLCIALTVLLAELLKVSPGWIILILALLHFVVAAAAAFMAVNRLKTGVFTTTFSELKKDQEWLKQPSN